MWRLHPVLLPESSGSYQLRPVFPQISLIVVVIARRFGRRLFPARTGENAAQQARQRAGHAVCLGVGHQPVVLHQGKQQKVAVVKRLVQKLSASLPNGEPTRLNPALSGFEGCLFRETSR